MLKLMAELPFKFAEALRKHGWFDRPVLRV